MTIEKVYEKLEQIELAMAGQKEILNLDELCAYARISKSHAYKLTSQGKLPFSKPEGKMIYFQRKEIDKWLLKNPTKTAEQINNDASTYVTLNRGVL